MRRFVCSLVLVLGTSTIVAAPVPVKTGWNKSVDPSRDCKFVYKGGTLTIELPGSDHDLAPKRKRFNAPRVLRDVEGDFVMQVRVSGSFHPSAKSCVEGEEPSVAAGLVLIPAVDHCIRIEYGAYSRNGDQRNCPAFRMRGEKFFNVDMDWQVPWKKDHHAGKEEHIYLRLERRGRFIYEAISPDGKEWNYEYRVEDPKLPAKLHVGMAAYSTSSEPFKACFDHINFQQGRTKNAIRNPCITFKNLK